VPRAGGDEITRDGGGEAVPMVPDGIALTINLVWNNLLVMESDTIEISAWAFRLGPQDHDDIALGGAVAARHLGWSCHCHHFPLKPRQTVTNRPADCMIYASPEFTSGRGRRSNNALLLP
jgi:hypothetical protein